LTASSSCNSSTSLTDYRVSTFTSSTVSISGPFRLIIMRASRRESPNECLWPVLVRVRIEKPEKPLHRLCMYPSSWHTKCHLGDLHTLPILRGLHLYSLNSNWSTTHIVVCEQMLSRSMTIVRVSSWWSTSDIRSEEKLTRGHPPLGLVCVG
jgi:hypothetical protein